MIDIQVRMWYTPKCQEAMEIADGRSVRDTGREVKRTDRLTLNIDKFILLDRTEARKPDGQRKLSGSQKKFLTNGFRYGIIQRVKTEADVFQSILN